MKVQISAQKLTVGAELANGATVTSVSRFNFGQEVLWTDSNGGFHEDWYYQPVALKAETNCIYGGHASGHSVNCTADSCY